MNLKIYDHSKNYTATIVRPKVSEKLQKLDNLVGVSVMGYFCLVPKTYDLNKQYVLFPAECQISDLYLGWNDMFRDSTQNADKTAKGYFEDNGRVKAIKLQGNKSTGLLMPVESLKKHPQLENKTLNFNDGDEFNEIHGVEICRKYVIPTRSNGISAPKQERILDSIVDSKQFPEHIDTSHLVKNLQKLQPDDEITVTFKLHGTSARTGNVLTKRRLSVWEKVAKWLGIKVAEEEYSYVAGSRRVVKSVDFDALAGKKHFYAEDLWTQASKEYFEGKLNKGEMVYYELIGKDYTGAEIQSGYTYGYEYPKVFIYRITNINAQGIEIDLPWKQVKVRAAQLGLEIPKEIFSGGLRHLLYRVTSYDNSGEQNYEVVLKELEDFLSKNFMDKYSYLDDSVIEEGVVLRVEKYCKPDLYKMKAPEFLIHEGKLADKEVLDIETAQS